MFPVKPNLRKDTLMAKIFNAVPETNAVQGLEAPKYSILFSLRFLLQIFV